MSHVKLINRAQSYPLRQLFNLRPCRLPLRRQPRLALARHSPASEPQQQQTTTRKMATHSQASHSDSGHNQAHHQAQDFLLEANNACSDEKIYALYYFLPKNLEKKLTRLSGRLLLGAVVTGLVSRLSSSACKVSVGSIKYPNL